MQYRTLFHRLITGLCITLLLSGCWDYRAMDQINIVAGIAIDKAEDGEGYALTLEIVNVVPMKEGGNAETILVDTEGPTIFEAMRNAKNKLYHILYFGSMRSIIIGEALAEDYGILPIIDTFLNGIDTRETVLVVVAKDSSAKELITTDALDNPNTSYEIAEIIQQDKQTSAASKQVELFAVYNMLHAPGLELVLPVCTITSNQDKKAIQISGTALFHGDKLVDYLTAEETHYYLLVTEEHVGGVFSFYYADKDPPGQVALEINRSKNALTFDERDGQLTIHCTLDVGLGVVEFNHTGSLSRNTLPDLQQYAEQVLKERILEVFQRTQRSFGFDVYGFGHRIYEDDYALWQKIAPQYEEQFKDAVFEIEINADISSSGLIFN